MGDRARPGQLCRLEPAAFDSESPALQHESYLPNCSFYRNCLYLDVEAIADVQESSEARRLLTTDDIQSQFESLRKSEYVEYEKVSRPEAAVPETGFR